jgi:DNA repair ATPase RecN
MTDHSLHPSGTTSRNHRGLLIVGGILAAGVLAASAFMVYDYWRQRPNLYNPARIEIVKAQRHLSEAYRRSTKAAQLRQEMQEVRVSLEKASSLLGEAERLDLSDKNDITRIRARLKALEDEARTNRMTAAELHTAYEQLSQQLGKLAQKLE